MKKLLISISLFIPFAAFIYCFLLIIWGTFAPSSFQKNLNYRIGGHMYERIREAQLTSKVDILFLGSSHSYRGFDPRIFKKGGFSTFNLGSSSQSPLQTEVLLKRYLIHFKPNIIIYEVYPGTFSSDGVESSINILANDKNDMESIKMSLIQNHIKVYNALIFSFYKNYSANNPDELKSDLKEDDEYISGGYVQKKEMYNNRKSYKKNKWKLNNDQFSAFEKTINLIKKENIRLILVQAPITESYYSSFSNNLDFDNKMKSYGEYYNFNELLQLDDSLHFYDSNHLNQSGVEVFNAEILKTIKM